MDNEDRGLFWMRATGASHELAQEHNKGYYHRLLNSNVDYPNPCFHQVEIDLNRTFTEMNVTESEKYIPALRNVLQTYVKRNPTVGYCQGMNFIVGRMLQYMTEE
jgi:Rab-GTPase-TBC domain